MSVIRRSILRALVLFALCILPGCAAQQLFESGKIREKIKPESILLAPDGTVGIKATASYFRQGFWDEDNHHPVGKIEPRSRFLTLSPSYLQKRIMSQQSWDERSTKTLSGPMILRVEFFVPQESRPDQDVAIIPAGYLDPPVTDAQIPPALRAPDVKAFEATAPVPYPSGRLEREILLDFSKSPILSSREKQTWRAAAAIPVGIVEAPVEVVGAAALGVLAFPFVAAFWLILMLVALFTGMTIKP